MKWLKRLLIGRPLENEALKDQKLSVPWGLSILSSDAISSVAYATEEILLVLVPAIGVLSYAYLSGISWAIIGLLAVLTFSYRQTIASYPNGGGAYVVASDNLGMYAGVAAGTSLAVDYTLTVAVSISSGTAAITSAFPSLINYRVEICLIILLLLFLGNLRGLRESSVVFGIPAYLFMITITSMVVVGIVKVNFFHYIPPTPKFPAGAGIEQLSILLVLRAFSSGCTALTGVEAVSNAVPNFKDPPVKHARTVLILLALVVLILFGGTSLLANMYHVVPIANKTVLSQIATEVFGGKTFMFYMIQLFTAIILALAANTAYNGFPMLLSVMARDGFAPRQLSARGERLSYSNGIFVLTLFAGILIVIFKGDTNLLIPLYAVGVFTSFTLSQSGMLMKWFRTKEKGWQHKAVINGFGAAVTMITVLIIGSTKFMQGAWIVILVIPIIMGILLKIKHHYASVAEQLRLSPEELASIDLSKDIYHNHVIVPIQSINKASIRALRYAKTISDRIIAFNVAIDEESEHKIREKWDQLNTDIPLIVRYSSYRKVLEPLLEFIESYEAHSYKKGDMITIVLSQFAVRTWWHVFLHNQTRIFIQNNLMKHKHIVIANMPLQLKKDNDVPTKL